MQLSDLVTPRRPRRASAERVDPAAMDPDTVRADFAEANDRLAQISERIDILRESIHDGYRGTSVPLDDLLRKREQLRSLAEEKHVVSLRRQELAEQIETLRLEELRATLEQEMEAFGAIERQVAESGEHMLRGLLAAADAWRRYEEQWAQYRAWDQRMRRLLGPDRNNAPSLASALATGVPADMLQLLKRMNRALILHEQRIADGWPRGLFAVKGNPTMRNIGNLGVIARLLRELRGRGVR